MEFPSEKNAAVGMKFILILLALIFLFSIFPGCKTFFSDYQGVFTSFGFLVAVIALFLTWHQIKATKKQIKARLVYQMRRDGDELINSLDPGILEFIRMSPKTELPKPDKNELKITIDKIFRYYSSLQRQNQYERIDKEEWELIMNNFCGFLRIPIVKEHWMEEVRCNESWSAGFRKLGEKCFQEKEGKK